MTMTHTPHPIARLLPRALASKRLASGAGVDPPVSGHAAGAVLS
jgi:hypothetical protein